MTWLLQSFQAYPELALFLALSLGFFLGKLKIGSFELGPVTGALIAGIIVGQLKISLDPVIRSLFFLMFLFAIGYSVGPQFVRGLKNDGLPQLCFGVLQCIVSLAVVYVIARVLHYDMGQAAGLLAGSHTATAALGVAADAINRADVPPDAKETFLQTLPVAYTVTYIFGTAGAAAFLAFVGPKMLGGDLVAECKQLESQLGDGAAEPDYFSAAEKFGTRAYRVENKDHVGKTLGAFESQFKESRVFVERIRRRVQLMASQSATIIEHGDVLAVIAPTEIHASGVMKLGPEMDDRPLLDFPIDIVDVVVANKKIAARTLKDLALSEVGAKARGVFVRKIMRSGVEIPFSRNIALDLGDILQLIGIRSNIDIVAQDIGYADRPATETDMLFVCLAIALGGLVGTLTVHFGKIPFQLSTNVGALLAGLCLGWLRSTTRKVGHIPLPALWILQNLGLTAFAAALGIGVGPSFIVGLKNMGATLFFAGVVATTVPIVAGILMGRFIFRFHPAVTLGATAGAQTSTASLAAIQIAAKSKTPVLGYSVPYAVASILLALWGAVIVQLLS